MRGIWAAQVVGSSVHFTANFWRFRPVDFNERSRLGDIAGASLVDWPISYDDLEPYYTKVDWEVGVSGQGGAWGEPRRSRPYPVPPLPVKSSGVLFERAARKLGWHPHPAPMAILSRPHNGRGACQSCGFCMGYGCEFGAKSSTLATMIPIAERTGRCEVRANCQVRKVELDAKGRATGVIYFDAQGKEQLQRARAVVLACNGAETPRLLLMSRSNRFPAGARQLVRHGGAAPDVQRRRDRPRALRASAQRVQGGAGHAHRPRLVRLAPKRGFYGGGGLDARADLTLPIFWGRRRCAGATQLGERVQGPTRAQLHAADVGDGTYHVAPRGEQHHHARSQGHRRARPPRDPCDVSRPRGRTSR